MIDFLSEDDEAPVPVQTTFPGSNPSSGGDAADWLMEQSENKIEPKPWMKTKRFILGTADNLTQAVDDCIASKRYGLDIEGTGLDSRVFPMPGGHVQTVDQIVGVCLSPDGVTGYYFPLRHVKVEDGERTALDCNIPLHVFDKEFMRLIEATEAGKTAATFHNGKFDQEFLQFNETGHPWGEWDKQTSWHDTMILAYMRNTRARKKGLKELSETPTNADENHICGGPGLGMQMIHLYELWGHESHRDGFRYDFSTRDPREEAVLWYAASDAICTWLLFDVLAPPVLNPDTDGKSMSNLYAIEKSCIAATRWMERCRIHIDRKKAAELIALGQKEWKEAILEVYAAAKEILGRDVMPPIYPLLFESYVADDMTNLLPQQIQIAESRIKGYKPSTFTKDNQDWPTTYDVEAPAQLGVMFEEMAVPGLKRSEKSNQIITNKAELGRIIEETGQQFPFMKKIGRFREVAKALSTFLYPMFLDSDPRDDTMRISFQSLKIDTGRFATPAKESSTGDGARAQMLGWPQVNVQATPNTNNQNRPACMLRIRECFTARPTAPDRPPKFFVSCDFSGVELRIVTNVSREPKWLNEFFRCSGCDRKFDAIEREPGPGGRKSATPLPPPVRCPNCGSDKIGDLHTLTAIAIYGTDAPNKPDWKALRGKAKSVNFALCYGGGPNAVVRAAGVEKNEGARIKRTFDGTYTGLKKWWDGQHKFARQHKYVRTAFQRKYPLPDITHPDTGFRAGAERNAVNGPIQGSSADITKIAMALIYKEMKKRGWLEKCMMTITMHDELDFEIDADIIEEAIPLIVQLMTANDLVLSLNWPIPLTSDVEIGFGWDVPWDWTGMTHKEVRFIGNKKYKDPKKLPEGVDWDTLSSWPDALKPWFSLARGENGPTSPLIPTPAASEPTTTVGAVTIIPSNIPKPRMDLSAPGEPYVYRLRSDMSPKTAVALATLLAECSDKGTRPIRLVAKTGEPIEGWLEEAGLKELKIDATTFDILARKANL